LVVFLSRKTLNVPRMSERKHPKKCSRAWMKLNRSIRYREEVHEEFIHLGFSRIVQAYTAADRKSSQEAGKGNGMEQSRLGSS
jgi:hypothetical protein